MKPWWAVVAVAGASALAACSSASTPGSPSQAASTTTVSASAAAGPSIGSQSAGASPGWAVVRATTVPTRLPTGLSREVAIVVGGRILVYGGFTSNGSTTAAI